LKDLRRFLFSRQVLLGSLVGVGLVMGASAQTHSVDVSPDGINFAKGRGWKTSLFGQRETAVAPADLGNTDRIHSLLKDGKLYLSLNDAIALAIENNLDIAIQRYNLSIADTDIMRAHAGGTPRGVSTGVVSGTPGGGGTSSGAGASGSGAGGTSSGSGGAGAGSAGLVTSTTGGGPAVGNLDPFFSSNLRIDSNTTPETTSFITGTNQLISHTGTANFNYNQAFLTGTSLVVGFQNQRQSSNNGRSQINPFLSSGLQVQLTQHLLQGFGTGVNNREIRISKNNREISDVSFRQQVMATVTQIENIYWDLVNANETLKVAEDSVRLANKTLSDNQRQVQIGTLAPIEITRARSAVATNQQTLIVAQTNLLYQGLLLKNAITKNLNDPILAAADVVPTDQIHLADTDPVEPIQDLIKEALQYRPELAISRIDMTNRRITLQGVRDELKPTVDLVAAYSGSGLAGTPTIDPRTGLPYDLGSFSGGYGRSLHHALAGNYPDYAVGINVQIPIFNRSGQADVIRSQLELRQAQLRQQQQSNQIVIEVRNAQYTLQQNRARVLAAQDAVTLSRQTLDAEQKKFNLGASTVTNVITSERDLTQAQSNLVSAMTDYQKSRTTLNQLTGRTLASDRVSIIDAENGHVTTMPQAH